MFNKDKQRYNYHLGNEGKRNIDFLLTFEEWWDIWAKSGHYHERGPKKGQYCMSRFGDKGPYAVGNVFIQRTESNTSQAQKGKADGPHTITHRNNIRKSLNSVIETTHKGCRPCLIDGVEYYSIAEASRITGIRSKTIRKMFDNHNSRVTFL